MDGQDWKADTRVTLLDLVRRGLFPPDEAEREAMRRGVGPLAFKPDPIKFDPERMPWWSLPMALAWIAWRNTECVREHCAEYRQHWRIWVPGSWNVLTDNGNEFARIDGYELKAVGPSTAVRLALVERNLKSNSKLPSTTKMTVSEAEQKLFDALAAGWIVAIGKDAAGSVVEIPQKEWPYLQLFEENECDVLKHDALDAEPTFTDIKLKLADLKGIWEDCVIDARMIEPMMRAGAAGYVPLCSAVHWIMTEAGQKVQHLEDSQLWKASVDRLFRLISTGEVQIIGKPSSGEAPKAIEGEIFAGILVSEPMQVSFEMITGDSPWVSCMSYIDEEHWKNGFNDELYLHGSGTASWTHLQVKKSDVLREVVFEQEKSMIYETGAPGRPTSMHLVREEFRARHERGESATSITQEANALAEWLRKAHPRATTVTPKTIKNQLSAEFRMRSPKPKNKV